MTIGERIKQRRIELGLSVDEVAEKLGKNRATVYRYESNDIENLPVGTLEPLATILETTPAQLMGWDDSDSHNSETDNSYYINEDAKELAQFLFENPEYRVLFDAAKDVSAEDLEMVKTIIDRFRK
jgi:DNA-binding helix-turn-helix protein|nr:MAG TPA: helix-turn-helix domain protein [Caudoviricetes sp.]